MPVVDDEYSKSVWHHIGRTADKYNEPGKFTAFIGYECTSFGSNTSIDDLGGSLHRVVLFKDGLNKTGKVLPFTAFDSMDPEDLWQHLEDYEKTIGGEVFAIPHSGNLSKGSMFSLVDLNRRPLDKAYAKIRNRWEPIYEATQSKGDSETHPLLSPEDEFSDYEKYYSNMVSEQDAKKNGASLLEHKKYDYVRSAWKLGLGQNAKLKVNPFRFGVIGSSDSHSSLAGVGGP